MSQFRMYVDIPVRPHVKCYLEQKICFKNENVITTTTPIGTYLMSLLEPKRKAWLPLRYNPENVIRVMLTDNYNLIVRPHLSLQWSNQFNLFVERTIKEEMYVFIDCLATYANFDINRAIKEFQNKYNIKEEDMTFDCLKQAYFRYRKALKTRDSKAA